MASLMDKLRKDPKRLAKWQSDPGLRSKLPTSALSGQQRQARQAQQTQRVMGNPLAPMEGNQLQRLARTVVDAEYKPMYADNDRQREQTVRDTSEIQRRAAGYFEKAYAGQDQLGSARRTDTTLDDRLKGINADASGQIDQARQRGMADISQDAEVRGADLGGGQTQKLAEQIAAGQTQLAQSSQTTRGGAAQGQEIGARFAEDMGGAMRSQGGEAQLAVGQRGQSMLADLLSQRNTIRQNERGDYTSTLLGMRDKQAEIELAKAGILGDGAKAAAQAQAAASEQRYDWKKFTAGQDAAADAREDEQDFKAGESAKDRKARLAEEAKKDKEKAASKRPKVGLGSLTQDQENKYLRQFEEARDWLDRYKGKADLNTVAAYLKSGAKSGDTKFPKLDPRLVAAALGYVNKDNTLSEAEVKILHDIGVHVGGKYKIKRKTATQRVAEKVAGGLDSILP